MYEVLGDTYLFCVFLERRSGTAPLDSGGTNAENLPVMALKKGHFTAEEFPRADSGVALVLGSG